MGAPQLRAWGARGAESLRPGYEHGARQRTAPVRHPMCVGGGKDWADACRRSVVALPVLRATGSGEPPAAANAAVGVASATAAAVGVAAGVREDAVSC